MGTIRKNKTTAPPVAFRTRGGRRPASNDFSSTLLQFQDEDRRRIARQLHDTVGQNIAALQMNLSTVQNSSATLDPRLLQALMNSLALTQTCVQQIRGISYELYPPLLDEAGLLPALRAYTVDYSQRTGVNLSLDLPTRLRRFEQGVEIALFRIAQEGLEILHRKSRGPTVLRIRKKASLVLELINPESLKDSDGGIARIEMRARHLGGQLAVEAGAEGTTLRIIVHSHAKGWRRS